MVGAAGESEVRPTPWSRRLAAPALLGLGLLALALCGAGGGGAWPKRPQAASAEAPAERSLSEDKHPAEHGSSGPHDRHHHHAAPLHQQEAQETDSLKKLNEALLGTDAQTKQEHQGLEPIKDAWCPHHSLEQYHTLEEASSACKQDMKGCDGVYNPICKAKFGFSLCTRPLAPHRSKRGSCLYPEESATILPIVEEVSTTSAPWHPVAPPSG
mmetsp:Transcript_56668/g.165796  ORF Transcript_56668/g.165796 Transcript_56668/m.165796 type:complete len:213 (-) Transcript_56668:116-754(-)